MTAPLGFLAVATAVAIAAFLPHVAPVVAIFAVWVVSQVWSEAYAAGLRKGAVDTAAMATRLERQATEQPDG